MLDEVIRELTTKSINDQTTSEDAQRMQAAILSDITNSQRFNQVKVVKQQAV